MIPTDEEINFLRPFVKSELKSSVGMAIVNITRKSHFVDEEDIDFLVQQIKLTLRVFKLPTPDEKILEEIVFRELSLLM